MNNLLHTYGWLYYSQRTQTTINLNELGRIRTVNKTSYEVITNEGILKGEITGRLLYAAEPDEMPQTGDWVKIMQFDTQCIITEILPRYSTLARKEAGKTYDKQIIAVNVDQALIVQGLDRDFNPRRLERMVTVLKDAGIIPNILLNKVDLVNDGDAKIAQIKSNIPNTPITTISALNNTGLSELAKLLKAEQTYILIGSSGAGKSTLINALMGNNIQATKHTSQAVGKGVHTTTRRELFALPNGSLIIDTAGVREFGLALENTESIAETFTDISSLAEECYYQDCTHINEPDCAVLKAIDEGRLSSDLYDSYIKLRNESEHYSTSVQDKKRKGKSLAKVIKNMKRYNIKKRY
ncbi:ribosome small subunit-dependent GTPase A [Carboxylicivirga sp. A043]|uniref:ribosome small subunit-dependent GTPase A n=1 Tax=Carboxylicivirga litoralis TaxID=2816963 RepID=UPI0021CB9954|nr:ribosome small subunit-dependent GTPase A [Carboxylicivirga sp. A043]MCU4155803.1 ribosome small subunit-dependent GTPase A [Carboxylicivirga sp. A043]